MRRHATTPRPGHERIVRDQGLVYNNTVLPNGAIRPFWDESVYYAFTLDEILGLERTVGELHARCLEAVEHVITRRRYRDLGIPRSPGGRSRRPGSGTRRRSTGASTCATAATARRSCSNTTPTPPPPSSKRR